ncbi:hypothetical protein H2136_21715 [Aeromonas hydrophila]|uniref:Uncharacterized protein n=1 Tax=Aeromonas hydrophila TaxID=644 RepID=A0A926IYE8_AERHY|nr:hypothetical protein [Aeromonas hydrophila]
MDKHAGHIFIPLAASMFYFHIGFLELDMCDFLMEGAPGIEAIAKVGRADGIALGSSLGWRRQQQVK